MSHPWAAQLQLSRYVCIPYLTLSPTLTQVAAVWVGRKGRGNSKSSGSVRNYRLSSFMQSLQKHCSITGRDDSSSSSAPFSEEQRETPGAGFGGFHHLISFRLCAQGCVCVFGVSSGIRGVRQGEDGKGRTENGRACSLLPSSFNKVPEQYLCQPCV